MGTETTSFCDDSHIASVVNFFLNLYKLQLEAPESSPYKIVPVKSQTNSPDYIYELHVERDEKWNSRRMTIATIGEGSGSKSKCFKVAYDNLIVVKIPPKPMTDFVEYVRNIRAEGRVAVNLVPEIDYVAPGVTAILKKIHPFSDGEDLSPEELERKYIKWLVKEPEFQECLKIGDSFVFFMDLSKNSFLSYVVDKMHDKRMFKRKFREEIMEARNLLWDILGFEGKYGSENLSICFEMNKIYSGYETKIRRLLKKYETFCTVSPYEKQKWFLDYLAEKEVKKNENNLPDVFVADLNVLLRKIVKENSIHVSAYKKAVRDYVTKTTFAQNRAKMAGIIINIIDLLASLKERGVAIRDLKPDNLFVVGNSERSAQDYSLGLIDFETSVKLKTVSSCSSQNDTRIPGEKIGQPLLAGTPSYATPSHLFRNEVLKDNFDDLPRILHLQDWQAVIGMIYNVVTGECLFDKTRKLLSKITKDAQDAIRKKQPLSDTFKTSSQLFWSSAADEFRKSLSKKEEILKSVEVFVPENARTMFLEDVLKEKNNVGETIRKYVVSQVILSSKKNRKSLIQSSLEKIVRYRTKLEKGGIPETSLEGRKKIIKLLQDLETLKLQWEKQDQWISILQQPRPRMSVYDLLELMFNIVLRTMYNPEWGTLFYEHDDNFGYDGGGGSRETTIVYEDTITYE